MEVTTPEHSPGTIEQARLYLAKIVQDTWVLSIVRRAKEK